MRAPGASTARVLTLGQSRGYLLQGILIPLWWLLIWGDPEIEALFLFEGVPAVAFYAFLIPDLILISFLSLRHRVNPHPCLPPVVLGAMAYGTLWCLSLSLWTGSGWPGTLIMAAGSALNVVWVRGIDLFQVSAPGPVRGHIFRTFLQSVAIWTLTLGLIPWLLLASVGQWPPDWLPVTTWSGGVLFLAASALGVRSGWEMAVRGRGTPLPMDTAETLVSTGPYAWVRNPMAVAGLSQGMAVALMTRSWVVAAYVLVGMGIWNFLIRPDEEAFLNMAFGEEYLHYQNQVRCWVPSMPKRKPDPQARV